MLLEEELKSHKAKEITGMKPAPLRTGCRRSNITCCCLSLLAVLKPLQGNPATYSPQTTWFKACPYLLADNDICTISS